VAHLYGKGLKGGIRSDLQASQFGCTSSAAASQGLADSTDIRRKQYEYSSAVARKEQEGGKDGDNGSSSGQSVNRLATSDSERCYRQRLLLHEWRSQKDSSKAAGSDQVGFWDGCEWRLCTDGKSRPIESSTFPLVDGNSFKLGSSSTFQGKNYQEMIKGYGNAIVIPLAVEFIKTVLEIL
jgi:hypothetical protein